MSNASTSTEMFISDTKNRDVQIYRYRDQYLHIWISHRLLEMARAVNKGVIGKPLKWFMGFAWRGNECAWWCGEHKNN